ncbi:hypothetical protein [Anabaena subtropica]|uniref:Uncharacterized protein n=1 Tax=Anabaena subtropica FACHB-260 TaxID=2692884 RepID=A0ABR8CU05_9NOST|nr:hypothetical protein [Anabaena subtropica]MBD2346256.1 hypothetical protein [Anabaena subtropica FACHB-260]
MPSIGSLNDNSTQEVAELKTKFPSLASPSTSATNKLKFNPSQSYEELENENIEIAKWASYWLCKENSKVKNRTNPFIERIQTNFLVVSSFSAEISNQVINTGSVALVNNFLNEIRSLYILSHTVEILQYLNEKKHLISILIEAHEKIKNIFNNEKNVLRVVYDPEIIGWKKLIIEIHTNLDVDEAFDKLKALDNLWWLDISFKFGNDLEINISFDEI